MSSHTKKRKNIFHLSQEQMLYAQKLLPKNYSLASLHENNPDKKENQPLNMQIPKVGPQIENLFKSFQKEPTKKTSKASKSIECYKQPNNHDMFSEQSNKFVDQNESYRQSNGGSKKSITKHNRKTKKQNPSLPKEGSDIGAIKDMGHNFENQSYNKSHQQIFLKQTIRSKQQESFKLSGSLQTALHISLSQKQFCFKFVNRLKSFKSSWPFRVPVDPVTQGVPDYLKIIKQPMDLRTIQKKIAGNKYEHISQFHGDINKILLNSYKFNSRQTQYYLLTTEFENDYHKLLKQTEANPEILDKTTKKILPKKDTAELDFEEDIKANKGKGVRNKKQVSMYMLESLNKIPPPNFSLRKKYLEEDRQELVYKFRNLSSQNLQEIIQKLNYQSLQDNEGLLKIDFGTMGEQNLEKFNKYFKQLQYRRY